MHLNWLTKMTNTLDNVKTSGHGIYHFPNQSRMPMDILKSGEERSDSQ